MPLPPDTDTDVDWPTATDGLELLKLREPVEPEPLPTVTYSVPHWVVPDAHTVMLLLPKVTPVMVTFWPATEALTALGLLLLLSTKVDDCEFVVPMLVVCPWLTVGFEFVKFRAEELRLQP